MSAADTTFARAESQPLLPTDKAAERPLWVMLIIMAFFAGLALMSARIGARNYSAWQSDLSGSAAVQLLGVEAHERSEQAGRAVDIVKAAAPNAAVQRVSDKDALALIEPWLGSTLSADSLPQNTLPAQNALPEGISIPVLITLDGSTKAERSAVSSRLQEAGFNAIVDDHSDWSGDIARTARAFKTGSWLILLISFFAATAATVFATQAVMTAQARTIAVFAQVGAADGFITKLFLKRAMKIGLVSGAVGALGTLGFLAFYRLLRGPANGGLLPSLAPSFGDILMLAAMAVVFGGVCAAAAYISAKQILHKIRLYS